MRCAVLCCAVRRGDFGRLGHGDCSDVFVPQQIAFFNSMAIKQVRVSTRDVQPWGVDTGGTSRGCQAISSKQQKQDRSDIASGVCTFQGLVCVQ
jgi:hypothetical protein